MLSHFTFSLSGTERIEVESVDVLKIRGIRAPDDHPPHHRRRPAVSGPFLRSAETTGMLLRSEILLDTKDMKARVTITFRPDDRFGLAVPVKMEESYSPSVGSRTVATATYGRFRQFEIKTEEAPKDPPPVSPAR
jgi:hypothetical protein